MGIAVRGDDLKDAVMQFENRNIESAAAQVVDGDNPVLLLVKAVRERSGRGFVHQSKNIKACNPPGVFGGLALRIVEVGGNGDYRLRDRTAEESLRIPLELPKNESGNLWRRVGALANLDAQHFSGLNIVSQMEREQL